MTYILTSHDFSWLQKGQENWVSRSPVIFFFVGAFLLDLRRPIVHSGESLRIMSISQCRQWMMINVEHGQRSISAKRPSHRVCDSRLTLACLRLNKSATLKQLTTSTRFNWTAVVEHVRLRRERLNLAKRFAAASNLWSHFKSDSKFTSLTHALLTCGKASMGRRTR